MATNVPSEIDAICLNSYPGWFNRAKDPTYDLDKASLVWSENIDRLRGIYPGKPIVITEFGSFSLKGIVGGPLGEDLQAQIIETESRGMTHPAVCGLVIWCYSDNPWPNVVTGNFDLMMSPFGVVTRERERKLAYYAAQKLFRSRIGRSI